MCLKEFSFRLLVFLHSQSGIIKTQRQLLLVTGVTNHFFEHAVLLLLLCVSACRSRVIALKWHRIITKASSWRSANRVLIIMKDQTMASEFMKY